jgi:hypothetical protein
MSIRAANIGIDAAIASWECANQELPYFSVWYNQSQICLQYNGNDYQASKAFLYDNLSRIADTGDNSLYYLNVHPEFEKFYTKKSPSLCSIPLRLNALAEAGIGAVSSYNRGDNEISACMSRLTDTVVALNAKMDALVDEPVVDNTSDMLSKISGIISHPAVSQLLTTFMPMISGFFNRQSADVYNAPMALAGVDKETRIYEAGSADAYEERLNAVLPC